MKKVQIGFTAKKNPSDEISEWQYDVISLPDDFTMETIKEELKERYWEVSNIRVFRSEELVPDKPRSDYVEVDTDNIILFWGASCECDIDQDGEQTLTDHLQVGPPVCPECGEQFFFGSCVLNILEPKKSTTGDKISVA